MRRFGAWVAILFLILYLVFIGGSWFGIYVTALRAITVALAAIVLGTWAVVAWREPRWRPRSALMPAILAALTSLAASTLFSRFPRQSIEYLGYAVLLAAMYLLLVRILADPLLRARIAVLAVALTGVLGAAFTVANIGHWVEWWGLVGRLAVPPLRPDSESLMYGNPSAVLTIVLLFWCSAAAVLGTGTGAKRAALGALTVLTLFTIFVSGSRAGWIAVAIAVMSVAAIWISGTDRRRLTWDALRSVLLTTRGRVVLGAVLLGTIAVLIGFGPTILRRLTEGGENLRVAYVLAAIRMFAEAPIFGTGPGSWVIQRIRYTISPEVDYYIPHAHNIYAQTLAELGIVGAIAGIVVAVMLIRLIWPALRDRDAARRRWGWAAAFALIYFGAHQLLDFYMNMPAVLFAAALPVAWLDATVEESRAPNRTRVPPSLVRAGQLGAMAVVALASAGLLWTERAASLHADAVAAYNDGNWAAADRLATAAVAAEPVWSPYQFTMGLTAAAVGDHERAAEAFARVATTDDLPEAWLDLAAEQAQLGDETAAHDSLSKAARLGLQRAGTAMAIGDLADRLGETELAVEAFAAAVSQVPSLAGDPWWQADPARASQFEMIVDAAIALAPGDGWQIALMAGDTERARSLAPPPTVGPDPFAANDVIDAWLGDASAYARVRQSARTHPLDAAVGWSARLAARSGDRDTANRYLESGFVGNSVAALVSTEMRVSDRVLLGRTIAGSLADFWGTYTFRRPLPWNMLVPSLVELAVQ